MQKEVYLLYQNFMEEYSKLVTPADVARSTFTVLGYIEIIMYRNHTNIGRVNLDTMSLCTGIPPKSILTKLGLLENFKFLKFRIADESHADVILLNGMYRQQ